MEKSIRTVCQGCHSECGVIVTTVDGRIEEINGDPGNPMSRGFICARGRVQHHFTYHPDRLKYPLKKSKGNRWEKVSWEQALDEIADRFTKNRNTYGAHSLATMHGTGPRGSSASTRFLGPALMTPNVISTDLHICYAPSVVAEACTVGQSIMMEKGPDYLNAKCILVVGGNPLISHPPRGMDLLEAKRKKGAKLIVVDPRKTRLAKEADLWLQIRPGTDLALALGMLKIIIDEELYDQDFVTKWCHGFEQLKEHVSQYPLEEVAEITWLPSPLIRQAALMYATTRPAVLHHRVAIEHNINSTQTSRALAALVALTGNIDVPGGNLFTESLKGFKSSGFLRSDAQFKVDPEDEQKRIGSDIYPLISGPEAKNLFVHADLANEAMLSGNPYPLKALYCAGGNPVINTQDCRRVWQALQKLDTLVVTDFFMTPTAELAHYVLPAATWLERDEYCDGIYVNYLGIRQKAIEPIAECWDDLKIIMELVKRIPWSLHRVLPWQDVAEYNEWRVSELGHTFAELKALPFLEWPVRYKKYEEIGFSTPTGKVELYSTIFKRFGYETLPSYHEPPESPSSTPELAQEYPLILITGSRYMAYYHSDGRQISQLRRMVPDPEIEIHPDTAAHAGISDGDWVWIETPRGRGQRITMKAKLISDIDPRVVHAAHGWWFPEKPAPEHGCFDSNINVLLSFDGLPEPICGSVPTRGTLCRVYKEKIA
ncbi:molybdopterin-dependent oxidoreductase [Chloroflexota bacterium]